MRYIEFVKAILSYVSPNAFPTIEQLDQVFNLNKNELNAVLNDHSAEEHMHELLDAFNTHILTRAQELKTELDQIKNSLIETDKLNRETDNNHKKYQFVSNQQIDDIIQSIAKLLIGYCETLADRLRQDETWFRGDKDTKASCINQITLMYVQAMIKDVYSLFQNNNKCEGKLDVAAWLYLDDMWYWLLTKINIHKSKPNINIGTILKKPTNIELITEKGLGLNLQQYHTIQIKEYLKLQNFPLLARAAQQRNTLLYPTNLDEKTKNDYIRKQNKRFHIPYFLLVHTALNERVTLYTMALLNKLRNHKRNLNTSKKQSEMEMNQLQTEDTKAQVYEVMNDELHRSDSCSSTSSDTLSDGLVLSLSREDDFYYPDQPNLSDRQNKDFINFAESLEKVESGKKLKGFLNTHITWTSYHSEIAHALFSLSGRETPDARKIFRKVGHDEILRMLEKESMPPVSPRARSNEKKTLTFILGDEDVQKENQSPPTTTRRDSSSPSSSPRAKKGSYIRKSTEDSPRLRLFKKTDSQVALVEMSKSQEAPVAVVSGKDRGLRRSHSTNSLVLFKPRNIAVAQLTDRGSDVGKIEELTEGVSPRSPKSWKSIFTFR